MTSTVAPLAVGLRCPQTGGALTADTPWSLAAGELRWPVVDGIPWLRTGRDELRLAVLGALDAGRAAHATALLLADRDAHDRQPPCDPAELVALASELPDAPRRPGLLRDAMTTLRYGPVGDYFAHRWSDPTYLSGLALTGAHVAAGQVVVELCCGIGHLLADLHAAGVAAVGADVVFSKLWLARHLVAPHADLVCFDATGRWPLAPGTADLAVCHDALYFLPAASRPAVVAGMRRTARGLVAGHLHNSLVDNLSAGEPLTPAGWAALLGTAELHDDAALTASWLAAAPLPPASAAEALVGAAAVAAAAAEVPPGALGPSLGMPAPGRALRINPLLDDGAGGLRAEPAWPSTRYRDEYAALSGHLVGAAGAGRDELVRRRLLVDLPSCW